MGLDQFLLKRKKTNKTAEKEFENMEYEEWKNSKVAQWRKSNQVHKWFVDTIQDGNDDCGYYKVSKEKLQGLITLCKTILNETSLIDGDVISGFIFNEQGEKIPQIMKGKVIDKPEICRDLLPTQEGFFFGSIDYDEYYYEDIKYTYETLNEVLANTDWDNEELYYSSSW